MKLSIKTFILFILIGVFSLFYIIYINLNHYENEVANNLGNYKCRSDVRYLLPTKNKGEIIYGTDHVARSLNYVNNDIQMTRSIFHSLKPSKDSENYYSGNFYAINLRDNSIYVTRNNNGFLLSPDLEVIRKDRFEIIRENSSKKFNIKYSWISPNQDVIVFSEETSRWSSGFWMFDLVSRKMLLHNPDETCIGLANNKDKVYLLSFDTVGDENRTKIKIRESSDWKIINEIPLENTDKDNNSDYIVPSCFAPCEILNNHKRGVVIGATDGRLIILSFPSFEIKSEIKLSSFAIWAMCTVDDKTVAVGDRTGQIYLVNIISGKIKKLPTIECDSKMEAMAYQPSSGILAVGFNFPHVRMWKLKDAAFVD